MSETYGQKVTFNLEKAKHCGYIEKEYENSYLVHVNDPSADMVEKYTNRMIVSKKNCELIADKAV
ncbi:hypothetical protein [Enterococcus sp. HY326]|uniref:hypothetical protein n=1 Tax=Enterococcus sp. HY326 TaxID=2971265 RepID=UPI00223F06C5|nr:hypothetical protein [Enterococcus sp. HY326]